MLLTAPTNPIVPAAPLGDATPPTAPDLGGLAATFTDLAAKLTASDETITSMVADRSPVGTGWAPHLSAIAGQLQVARDQFLDAKPDATDLGAKLGADVIKLAEASGSMSIMARQRATLSEGWTGFLDVAIANATEAAALLAPSEPKPDKPGEPDKPNPPANLPPQLVADVTKAAALVQQSLDTIATVPTTDKGDASTKDARIKAFQFNKDAQAALEQHFNGEDAGVTSQLRTADASLEDAAWQLAKKPSPDGRFTGVDIPGALSDTQSALDALNALVAPAAV